MNEDVAMSKCRGITQFRSSKNSF